MTENRTAMNPADLIGKWGLVGSCGGWAAWNEPNGKLYSRFAAEALLYDTKEEALKDVLGHEFAEQVVDLWRKKPNEH